MSLMNTSVRSIFFTLILLMHAVVMHAEDIELTILALPEAAEVSINGVSKGQTPLTLPVPSNSIMKIQVKISDLQPLEYDFQATQNETLTFDLNTRIVTSNNAQAVQVVPDATPTPETPPPLTAPDTECSDKSKVDTIPTILLEPKFGSIPIEIQNLKMKGKGKFRIFIDGEGRVMEASVTMSTGNPELDAWIIPVLKKTEWEAAKKGESAIPCVRDLNLEFDTIACKFKFIDLYK